jgi:hypothetical protein
MLNNNTTRYAARIIKDLTQTFNFTPVTPQELARYWKRSALDVIEAAKFLQSKQIVNINKNKEMTLTSSYKQFFKRNPDVALSIAQQGF